MSEDRIEDEQVTDVPNMNLPENTPLPSMPSGLHICNGRGFRPHPPTQMRMVAPRKWECPICGLEDIDPVGVPVSTPANEPRRDQPVPFGTQKDIGPSKQPLKK